MMYHRMMRQDITVNMMTEKKMEEVPEPSEAAINELFSTRSAQMIRKGRVRASHLLVKFDADDKGAALEDSDFKGAVSNGWFRGSPEAFRLSEFHRRWRSRLVPQGGYGETVRGGCFNAGDWGRW